MRKALFIILLIASVMPVGIINAQQVQFSGTTESFPGEVSKMLESGITEKNQLAFNNFVSTWSNDSLFTEDQKKNVIDVANRILKVKGRPYPHIYNFLINVQLFYASGHSPESYQNWLHSLDATLQQPKVSLPRLNNLLENTLSLLSSSTLSISGSVVWKTSSSNFSFVSGEKVLARYANTDLICNAKRDSISIYRTSGMFDPMDNLWLGEGGTVTWDRSAYPSSDVFATLNTYTLDLNKPSYTADSVIFTNKQYFNYTLLGKLTDEVKLIKSPEDADFPAFESYKKNFDIRNFYKNINYTGGLSMQGARLVGKGTLQEPAHLYLYRHDSLFMKITSLYFVFRKDRVIGRNVGLTLLFEKDSMYHSELNFLYMVNSNEISFVHTDEYTSNSPYFNSYHNIDMSFDQLTWKVGDPKVILTMQRGSSIGMASFESTNFFSGQKYEEIQAIDEIHPLVAIRKFVQYFYSEEFPATEYARYMKQPIELIRVQLLRLSVMGFVYYNIETDMARVKPKLYDYINASVGRIDYDVMSLVSRTDAPLENATLDLKTFDLAINGIPQIFLSDSQNVVIYPANGHIIMKRNRSFQFDGRVDAGLFTYFGKNFFFNYADFKINLQNVDSLFVRVVSGEKDEYGRDIIKFVRNVVQQVTGELLIDQPDNKSGVKRYPKYPIFYSRENSYVYFEKSSIQQGVYKKKDFYFQIYPYTIDSLDNFKKEDMKFNGKFVSAGILPPLEQTLSLQPDYSLGFSIMAPSAGYPLYGGKGTVYNNVKMSNLGLKVNGSIDYLTSTSWSSDFNMYPDSVNAVAEQYAIKQKNNATEYPHVDGKNVYVHWMPKKDMMFVNQKTDRFAMYNDSTSFTGRLKLTPRGLTGDSLIDMRVAQLHSNKFAFKSTSFDADTADFKLRSLFADEFTMLTKNVKSHIDFGNMRGAFKSNNDLTLVEFPENQYISYLDNFVWKMDVKEVEMGSAKKFDLAQVPSTYRTVIDAEDKTLVGARYISTNIHQDSLSFISPLTFYDYKENIIRATRVKYIKVADARIIPNKGRIEIEQRANMRALDSASVIANMDTRYHTIHSAHLKIAGRYGYSGSGNYNYKDENKKIQIIHFAEIEVDTNIQTIARGDILETQDFTLSPVYQYLGKVNLYADEKYLTFKGGVILKHDCEPLTHAWLSFTSVINPDSIYIPVSDKPTDINRVPIFSGLLLTSDSIHTYPAFLSKRKNYNDHFVHTASGFLYYMRDSSSFLISTPEKLRNNAIPGNLLSLNRKACRLSGEGLIDLGGNLGQFTITAMGNFSCNISNNAQQYDLMMLVDFTLLDKSLAIMGADFDSLPGLGAVDLGAKKYWKGIELIAGKEKALKMKDELSLYGDFREMPVELKKTLLISDIKMRWNDETNSYQSFGKIGIGNIMNNGINKYVDGFVELVKKRSGDICDIYLKLDDKTWYYFGYTRGVMQTLSSNTAYLNQIKALSPDDRMKKVEKGQTPYIYMLATDTKFGQFMRKYNRIMAGEQVEEQEEELPVE